MHRLVALATALALATACSPVDHDAGAAAWADLLPDDRIRVAMPDASLRADVGDPSGLREDARAVARDVNGLIDDVLDGIDHITSFEPTWADEQQDTALWGPWNDGAFDAMLSVQRFDDGHHAWALLVRDAGAGDDAWVPFVAGEVDPDATRARASGRFVLDLDVVAGSTDDLEPTWGRFASEYAVDGDQVTAEAVFEHIRDTADGPGVDAIYSYAHDDDGGQLEAAWDVDLAAGADLEALALLVRWNADGTGRGDAWATGGDLGAFVYAGTECWDPSGGLVFAEDNAGMTRLGDAAACAFDAVE